MSDIKEKIGKLEQSIASFSSKLGLGVGSDTVYSKTEIKRETIESMYMSSWIAARVIDIVAQDMTRAGVAIAHEKQEEINTSIRMVWNELNKLIKWGRLYGGAIAVLDIRGDDLVAPLNLNTIRFGQFSGIVAYDRWCVTPSIELNEVGEPASYLIHAKNETLTVHYTRVIRYIGQTLSMQDTQARQGWGYSELQRGEQIIKLFDAATVGIGETIHKSHLRMLGISGLREILSAGGEAEQALVRMIEMIAGMQSNYGITLIDAEDKYSEGGAASSVDGMNSALINLGQQVCGAYGIPAVILFGQSPAGMNATGASDIRMYYDTILSEQESRLRTGMQLILDCAARSAGINETIEFEFKTLWQMSESEKSAIAAQRTAAILSTYSEGVIDQQTALEELEKIGEQYGLFTSVDVNALVAPEFINEEI